MNPSSVLCASMVALALTANGAFAAPIPNTTTTGGAIYNSSAMEQTRPMTSSAVAACPPGAQAVITKNGTTQCIGGAVGGSTTKLCASQDPMNGLNVNTGHGPNPKKGRLCDSAE
jgi:hypothetical protein